MLILAAAIAMATQDARPNLAPGTLISEKGSVICPLQNTSVKADISGFAARVTVTQTFTNPSPTPIEAVYTFPLPADSAVDQMTMKIGERVIKGVIKRREEARMIYEAAKNAGQSAALLDQERPNIFTQSVANIVPKALIKIEISYVQILKYEAGLFEYTFPMVVGPRFLGNATDPGKISPPVIQKGTRTGAGIDLTVNLNAGAPIESIRSVLHGIKVTRNGAAQAVVTLGKRDEMPNRDFVLRYETATGSVQSALLAKYDPVKGGYFSLILLPPKAPTQQQIAPKQVIFVVDQSGSQGGFPIEKSRELTLKLIGKLNAGDTFNVLGFSNGVNPLWDSPRAKTGPNIEAAVGFVNKLQANGGTQLKAAVDAALAQQDDPQRVKLVVFNTDGFVGDEKEILRTIREHRKNSRMFTFGIGNSVNRYLIDAMSEEGRGDSEIVTLAESADGAVERFVQRTQNPILTDVRVSVSGVKVMDQMPAAVPDVFSDKPIIVYGRYDTPGRGQVTVNGVMAGKPWSQTIDVIFPSDRPGGEAIPTLWARRMVDKLERDYNLGTNPEIMPQEGKNQIVDLALEHGLMTQYTSFVAVEQRVVNIGGKQRTVAVPVEMADGVQYPEGNADRRMMLGQTLSPAAPIAFSTGGRSSNSGPVAKSRAGYAKGGIGGGAGGPGGIDFISYDPSDNSFVVSEEEIKKLPEAEQKRIHAERAKFLMETKVDKKLRKAKGLVEFQLWLTKLTPELEARLTKLGVKIAMTDKGLKIVVGSADASLIEKLSQMEEIRRIESL